MCITHSLTNCPQAWWPKTMRICYYTGSAVLGPEGALPGSSGSRHLPGLRAAHDSVGLEVLLLGWRCPHHLGLSAELLGFPQS